MKRREFIAAARRRGGVAAGGARAAAGQVADHRVPGREHACGQSEWIAAFVQRLRELGWIEGRNVAIEYRWGEGRSERFADIAAEFVRLKVDVIVTHRGNQSSRQSRRHRSSRSSSRAAADPVAQRPGRKSGETRRQRHRPIGPVHRSRWQSDSNFCARLSPVFAGWRSWPMSTIPPRGDGRGSDSRPHTRRRRLNTSEIRRAEDIAPAFETLKGRAEALYVCRRSARIHQPHSHQHLGARRAPADDAWFAGASRSGRL